MRTTTILTAILFGTAPLAAHAVPLTFEGTGLADNTAITTQFLVSHGITFGIDSDANLIADVGRTPFLEAVGRADADPQGFVSTNAPGAQDDEVAAQDGRLGSFFLRGGGLGGGFVPNLLISYSAPVTGASAEIWDIDATTPSLTEQWIVEAYNAAGTLVDSVTSPVGLVPTDPGSLDSMAWTWSVSGDISTILLRFVGTKDPEDIGLAFDNFNVDSSTAVVPEPGTLALFAAALLSLAFMRRKIRAKL